MANINISVATTCYFNNFLLFQDKKKILLLQVLKFSKQCENPTALRDGVNFRNQK